MRPMTSTRAPWHLGCNFKEVQNSDQLDPVGRWKLHRALNTAPFLVAKNKNLDIKISKSAHFFRWILTKKKNLPTHQISKTKNTVFFVQTKTGAWTSSRTARCLVKSSSAWARKSATHLTSQYGGGVVVVSCLLTWCCWWVALRLICSWKKPFFSETCWISSGNVPPSNWKS